MENNENSVKNVNSDKSVNFDKSVNTSKSVKFGSKEFTIEKSEAYNENFSKHQDNIDENGVKYLDMDVEYNHGRLIEKSTGNCNFRIKGTERFKYFRLQLANFYSYCVNTDGGFVLALSSISYVVLWLLFALPYYWFAIHNGDDVAHANMTSQHEMCVDNVYDYVTAFLFAMESETTIGYGSRGITTSCKHAVVYLTLQCVISILFGTLVVAVVSQRIARPDRRKNTLRFTKNAVICDRNGYKCLIFRVANLRRSLLISTSINAKIVSMKKVKCDYTKTVRLELQETKFEIENKKDLLFTQPVDYYHIIDERSPLYHVEPYYFSKRSDDYFEVIISFCGTMESTGGLLQVETSYLNTEILYGKRFKQVIFKDEKKGRYIVDYEDYDATMFENPEDQKQNNLHIEENINTVTTVIDMDADILEPVRKKTRARKLSESVTVHFKKGTTEKTNSNV